MSAVQDPEKKASSAVLDELRVDVQTGLSASEVKRRLEEYGRNQLPDEPKTSFWKLVLDQFEDTMVRILLAAAFISYVISAMEGDYFDVIEPGIILLILIMNAIVGVFQENRAENAIDALKTYAAVTAVVLRGGQLVNVDAEELVPGDITEIRVGNRVPADIRLVEILTTTFRTDQSILSGESEEVMKMTEAIAEAQRYPVNMIFSGTSVVYGRARGVVVRTGSLTEIGSIQRHVQEQDDVKTPLQLKLDEFGVLLSKVIGYICLAVFAVNMLHWYRHFDATLDVPLHEKYGDPIVHSLKVAVALAVAAIPEGLPAVVTTCLALGTRRLSHRNALVRDLGSVETLGRCTVICSDKTGTLTTNMMSVMEVCTLSSDHQMQNYRIEDSRYDVVGAAVTTSDGALMEKPFNGDAALEHLALVCVLCNEAALEFNLKRRTTEKIGEATEAALLVLSEKLALGSIQNDTNDPSAFYRKARNEWNTKAILEFTRRRKSMSVRCRCTSGGDSDTLFVKGAPEDLLERSSSVMRSDGSTVPLSAQLKDIINQRINVLSGTQALRCIGCAIKALPHDEDVDLTDPSQFAEVEADLTFVGVCGLIDPPREDIPLAVAKCRSAGIRVVVITGDKKETGVAICQKIGLLGSTINAGEVFTGAEFDAMSSEAQRKAASSVVLCCRADPSNKMQLINVFQAQNHICAMTGDGVNDSPALKKADIGVAMGSGTEVAKAASNMVLADDNFSTMVNAVAEGRCIFNNTKQFIRYLISSNIGEVACVLATGIFGLPEALTPIQLLWVNLVTDGLPATALSFNKPDDDIMSQPPRSVEEPIVSNWMFARYLIIGAYVGISTVAGFLWWFFVNGYTWDSLTNPSVCLNENDPCGVILNPKTARAIALSNLVIVEMFNALNALSENSSIFVTRPTSNMWLLFTIASSIALHLIIMYVPFFSELFSITPLGVPPEVINSAPAWSIVVPTDFTEWKVILVCSAPVIFIDEVLKLITRIYQRNGSP